MRLPIRGLLAIGLLSSLATVSSAQEGHPAKGSWIGEWQGNSNGESVLVVMNWDGKNITGIINPGTDNLQIADAELDPSDWSIHIEAGDYEIDGTFERLELPNRSITGTWRNGNASGPFEIVRQ